MGKIPYCRACGSNKGHDFSKCKNFRELRKVILLQDAEIDNLMAAQRQYRDSEEELATANTQLKQAGRFLNCLITLVERCKS